MNYLSSRQRTTLTNDPVDITYEDLRVLWMENQRDAEECSHVTESTDRGETYYPNGTIGEGKMSDFRLAFYKEVLYHDTKSSGVMMEYPHGTVICQGERNNYYRGENQQYPKSQPILFRQMERYSSQEGKELYRLVADMRVGEFSSFLNCIKLVNFWKQNYGTVLYEALAQHYGLETCWLDITNDFAVALFFATCRWTDGQWQPLTNAQIEQSEQTRYGIIFHIPAWNVQSYNLSGYNRFMKQGAHVENMILPIGFQPFMRCHSQYGYGIPMLTPTPLQENILFEKLRFRQSEKLSQAVFDAMKGGELIYPQEGLDDFQDVIEQIQNATCFSEDAFAYALKRNPLWREPQQARQALIEGVLLHYPVQITEDVHPYSVSRQRMRRFDRRYQDFDIVRAYGVQPKMRMVYCREG